MNPPFRPELARRVWVQTQTRPSSCQFKADVNNTSSAEGVAVSAHGAERQFFLERIYRAYWSELCAKLRRRFGEGPPDPEDIAQQAFVKFYEANYINTHPNPKGLIYRIAANLIVDFHRAKSRWEGVVDTIYDELNLDPIQTFNAESALFETELLSVIAQAIGQLPEKQRTILIESRLHGKSYKQISRASGWSLGDISRNNTAAMAAVHTAVTDWRDGPDAPSKHHKTR